MPWLTAIPVLIWAVIMIPVTVLIWIQEPDSKLSTLAVLLAYILANLYAFFCINWVIVNYWYRAAPILLILVMGYRLLNHLQFVKWQKKSRLELSVIVVCLLVSLAAGYLNYRALMSFTYKGYVDKKVLVMYPLRNGMYVTLNGGNGIVGLGMSNQYQNWIGQKTTGDQFQSFAVDMVKMTIGGQISQGILPHSNTAYEGFNDQVYSPCVGEVVYTQDSNPDRTPWSSGAPMEYDPNILGNRIVIQCADYYVTLAGLHQDSIIVKVGDRLNLQMQVARLGNSGSPAIPHLHMFASYGGWNWEGEGIPMIFPKTFTLDKFLARNDLFIP